MSNMYSPALGSTWFTVWPHPIESSEAERKLVTYPQPLGKEKVEVRFEPKQV